MSIFNRVKAQRSRAIWALVLFGIWSGGFARAGETTLAVAANLLPTAEVLVDAFEGAHDHQVRLVHGSTGRLYAQIVAQAPFDVFLAADVDRPARLAADGLAVERRTYAIGRLALVGRGDLDSPLAGLLAGRRVALADPAVAPYGAAAMDVLAHEGVDPTALRLLTGESIGQVGQFLATGNAEYGFLALSLVERVTAGRGLSARVLPSAWHRPVLQDGVLLRRGSKNPAAQALWAWLATPEAAAILRADGYEIPSAEASR